MATNKKSLRQYQPIWNTLRDATMHNIREGNKSSAKLLVRCPPQNRKKLHKAVTKEKWLDDWAYKYFFKLTAEYTEEGIVFRLVNYRLTQIISEKL